MEKMEETIRAMQKKMTDLQQQQGDNIMGARMDGLDGVR
jgi:hypothetical protein